ncbi:MAG: putative selenate ABC transporter substrate-binding protein [Candidatus Tectimicrobiota bacterium]|nr:MAG: putative selenate ABC transporter substrate-binding protein [Candidatus Tectomicrobia bacterium]
MRRGLCFLVWLVLVGVSGGVAAQGVLRLSAIPDEAPTELLRKYQPLVRYLEKELGMRVEFTPVIDYAASVEALAAGKVDMVWYGGFTHVQARHRTGGKAFAVVMRAADLNFHSKFIAHVDAGIERLEDLKGKTFAFGSVGSTSGHLMPRYFLLQAGIVPERDFRRFSFSGAHDATAKWVESGKVDAGALNEAVWDKLVREGKVDTTKVKVFWTTPPYVDYNWTVRADLDRLLVSRIARAFLNLDYHNPEHRPILELQRAKAYVLAVEDDFAGIEAAARAAGLLK